MLQMKRNGATITISGDIEAISHAGRVIATTRISGIEIGDRLAIQKAMDDNDLKATITYNGRPVVGRRRILENMIQMRYNGLTAMSDETYQTISTMFDFPRINKETYIKAYRNSYKKMMKGLVLNHVQGMPDVNMVADMLESERKAM